MKNFILIVGLLNILIFSGCGYKEGVQSEAQKSYVYFSGNNKDVEVSIDGNEKFSIKSGKNNQYSLKPGKHLIEVYKNGVLVVKREIFLSDGVAKEIEVK